VTQATAVLGDEFDDELRAKLMNVLRQLGAIQGTSGERFVVGSQDFEKLEVLVGGRSLQVEAETYVGLSIRGPDDLVEQVRRLVSQ